MFLGLYIIVSIVRKRIINPPSEARARGVIPKSIDGRISVHIEFPKSEQKNIWFYYVEKYLESKTCKTIWLSKPSSQKSVVERPSCYQHHHHHHFWVLLGAFGYFWELLGAFGYSWVLLGERRIFFRSNLVEQGIKCLLAKGEARGVKYFLLANFYLMLPLAA